MIANPPTPHSPSVRVHQASLSVLEALFADEWHASLQGSLVMAGDAQAEFLDRYRRAFSGGHAIESRQSVKGKELIVRRVFNVAPAARIRLPSGRLAARDPLASANETLSTELPPGTYDVDMSTCEFCRIFDGERSAPRTSVAWLRLNVSRAPVVRFELSDTPEICVDSGLVAIMSAELSDAERVHVHAGGMDGWLPRYHDAFGAVKGKLVWQYPTTDEPELVAVWPGDGVYTASWGYDASGTLACLAIEIEAVK